MATETDGEILWTSQRWRWPSASTLTLRPICSAPERISATVASSSVNAQARRPSSSSVAASTPLGRAVAAVDHDPRLDDGGAAHLVVDGLAQHALGQRVDRVLDVGPPEARRPAARSSTARGRAW